MFVQLQAERAKEEIEELEADVDRVSADGEIDRSEYPVVAGMKTRLAAISTRLDCVIAAQWIVAQLFRLTPERVPDRNLSEKLHQVVMLLKQISQAGKPIRLLAAKEKASARDELAKAA